MSEDTIVRQLHLSLVSREMPETIARLLQDHPAIASDEKIAKLLTKRSRARRLRSSMPETWFEPVDLREKIRVANELFVKQIEGSNDPRAAISPVERDPKKIAQYIAYLSESIGKKPNKSSFLRERLNREGRSTSGIELSNHAYNKRFRLLNRMSDHLGQFKKELRFLNYRIVGKTGVVADVEFEDFASDIWSAAFTSYYAARKRRRSVFTNRSQSRPFDDLCEALLSKCENTNANWPLIARVLPEKNVLKQLSDEEIGFILGQWLIVLRDLSHDLSEIWQNSSIDLDSMIVRRGNDSSTWNLGAQAWNSARNGWLAFNSAVGAEGIFEKFLPGKVLRLMAADVAAWHRATGGNIHPDTLVWRELPFPWEVMQGRAPCNRQLIEKACRRAGIDPVKSGWSTSKISVDVEAYAPTPELVHGVQIASPELAAVLRRLDWFSGKP